MPATSPNNAFNFRVDIDGTLAGFFTEVRNLNAAVEVIAYREGGGPPAPRLLPGRAQYQPVQLCWGVGLGEMMWPWLMSALQGNVQRRDVSVIMFDGDGVRQSLRFNLFACWVCRWDGAVLNALGQELAIESMEVCFERLERVVPPSAGAQ